MNPIKEFVLIGTYPGKERAVYAELEKLASKKETPAVRNLHAIFGDYDIIAELEAGSLEEMGKFTGKVKQINGVRKARIYLACEG